MLLRTEYNHCTCCTRIDISTEIDFFNAITEGVTVYRLYAYNISRKNCYSAIILELMY